MRGGKKRRPLRSPLDRGKEGKTRVRLEKELQRKSRPDLENAKKGRKGEGEGAGDFITPVYRIRLKGFRGSVGYPRRKEEKRGDGSSLDRCPGKGSGRGPPRARVRRQVETDPALASAGPNRKGEKRKKKGADRSRLSRKEEVKRKNISFPLAPILEKDARRAIL